LRGVVGSISALTVDALAVRGSNDSHGGIFIPAGTRYALRLSQEQHRNAALHVTGQDF
jgi:hypothetical protein